jgi:hypothetical protein
VTEETGPERLRKVKVTKQEVRKPKERFPDKTSRDITSGVVTFRDNTSGAIMYLDKTSRGTKCLAGQNIRRCKTSGRQNISGDKTSGDITSVGQNICGDKMSREIKLPEK